MSCDVPGRRRRRSAAPGPSPGSRRTRIRSTLYVGTAISARRGVGSAAAARRARAPSRPRRARCRPAGAARRPRAAGRRRGRARSRRAVGRSSCDATPFERPIVTSAGEPARRRAAAATAHRVRAGRDAGEHEQAGERRGARQRRRARDAPASRAAAIATAGARLSGAGASSSSGRAAQTIASAPRSATLLANSVRCGAIRSVGEQPDADGVERGAPTRPLGNRLRVGDHEEEEDEHLGRDHEHPPEVAARDRRRGASGPSSRGRSARARRCRPRTRARSRRRSRAGAAARGSTRPPATMITSASASQVGHRRPPEVERVGAARCRAARKQSTRPKLDGLKRCRPRIADHVLREQRDRRRRGEDPPAAQAPPVAVLGSGDAKDEGDAVAGQERARRPHDHALAPERDRELEHGHVSRATRIWAIESWKPNATCPSTCSETITAARCSRGSRNVGSRTGYAVPRIRSVGLLGAGYGGRAHRAIMVEAQGSGSGIRPAFRRVSGSLTSAGATS